MSRAVIEASNKLAPQFLDNDLNSTLEDAVNEAAYRLLLRMSTHYFPIRDKTLYDWLVGQAGEIGADDGE